MQHLFQVSDNAFAPACPQAGYGSPRSSRRRFDPLPTRHPPPPPQLIVTESFRRQQKMRASSLPDVLEEDAISTKSQDSRFCPTKSKLTKHVFCSWFESRGQTTIGLFLRRERFLHKVAEPEILFNGFLNKVTTAKLAFAREPETCNPCRRGKKEAFC